MYQKICSPFFVTSFSVVAAMLLIMVERNVTGYKICVSEHMEVSARTGKSIKSTKNSGAFDHMLVCNSIVYFEDFSVLAK